MEHGARFYDILKITMQKAKQNREQRFIPLEVSRPQRLPPSRLWREGGLLTGFTLIEILIVVAIIAVLASAVLVGLGPIQRQGRDARRISDLRQAQNALELYYSKCGYYPGGVAAASCGAFTPATSWSDMKSALIGSNIGVSQIPNDPSSNRVYVYNVSARGDSYVLGADLEDGNNPAFDNSATGNVLGLNCGKTMNPPMYCIQF